MTSNLIMMHQANLACLIEGRDILLGNSNKSVLVFCFNGSLNLLGERLETSLHLTVA
jgi:hypothetical protein